LVQDHKVTGRTSLQDGQYLDFEDGERAGPFDLIIDAGGSHSPLSPLEARALPYGAIWTSVDWPTTELPADQLSQRYRRANRMVGVMPMGTLPNESTPKAALFWSMPHDGYDDWKAKGLSAWKNEAHDLWPEISPFLDQITSPEQMTMARYSHGTLKTPFSDGIVHIGDAAHRASPQLGQGANMALLDAWALSRALQSFPLETALPSYARARRGHVWLYQMMSAAFTPQYQSDSRILPFLRDNFFFPLSITPPVPRILTALVTGNLLPPLGYLTPQPPVQIDQD
jgi:2-polyprenyl-6-methoxyphenol hydroxylase-like FAD-dependent oxidoreductase